MTAEEHRRFIETDFSDVKLEELTDIGKIRIDRKKSVEEKKAAVSETGGKSISGKGRRYNGKDKIGKQRSFF